ncbi:MAG: DUF2162 domain-containing protein, partial [Thermodesulfovibrionales bacterium]|nr:DUF2162 domain-containing protein [Thermodesulfovibrionales bacterium]
IPLLKSGVYIHLGMSAGLALWGLALLISGCRVECKQDSKFKIQDSKLEIQDSKFKIQNLLRKKIQDSKDLIADDTSKPKTSRFKIPQSILLIIPCPVCITAIGISISSALSVLKTTPLLVGLVMGLFFIVLAGTLAYILKPKDEEGMDITLGLGMITIALYFIGSFFIPQKIEEAWLAYQAFSAGSSTLQTTQSTGVLLLFCLILILGFLFYKDIEDIL